MKGVREAHDALAPGYLAGELQGALDGVGARRAGELDLVVEAARSEDHLLETLEEAYSVRAPELMFLMAWHPFDGLRSDPRFQDILRRMGLY